MSKKIAIANQKGGCGKTATSINLAAALAEKGKRVLLVDLDPQLHATEGIGVDPYQEEIVARNVYHLIFDEKVSPLDVIVETGTPNLDLIPSSIDLEETDIDFFKTKRAEYKLEDKLKGFNRYDFIFFDCPPRLNHLTINALTAADGLIIPISSIGKRSLNNLPQFMRYVEQVQKQVNQRLEIMGYLVNMHRKRVSVSEMILNKTRELFGNKVFDTIISFTANLSEADLYDEPVVSVFGKSRLANEYRQLAEEIEKR
jgi:chromosome partitioning protein